MFNLWLPCPAHPEARMELVHLEISQVPIIVLGEQVTNAELIVKERCCECGATYRYRIPMNVEMV